MNATYDYDLICIGSGPAGQRAAVQAAKLGLRAAVVEKQRCAGGVCVDTGTIPSKTLREAVIFLTGTGSALDPRRRIRTEGRPTAEQLLSRVDDVVAREQAVIEDQLRRNDVTLLQGEASFLDPHRLQIVGEGTQSVSASRILIAVGTRPAAPPGVPADGEIVITSDEVIRIRKLPRSLAVVGAGVIGVEYASMFASLGVAVTLDRAPRAAARVSRPRDRGRAAAPDAQPQRHVPAGRGGRLDRGGAEPDSAGGALAGVRQAHRVRRRPVLGRARRGDRSAEPGRRRPARGRAGAPQGRRDVPHDGAAHLCRRRRHRLSQPGRDVVGAGPAGRLPRLRAGRRGDVAPLPDRHLRHPGDLDGRRHRAGPHPRPGALRDRASRAIARSRAARSWATTAGCSRCSSTARTAACSACTPSAPAPPS